jgi:hypothetical protein
LPIAIVPLESSLHIPSPITTKKGLKLSPRFLKYPIKLKSDSDFSVWLRFYCNMTSISFGKNDSQTRLCVCRERFVFYYLTIPMKFSLLPKKKSCEEIMTRKSETHEREFRQAPVCDLLPVAFQLFNRPTFNWEYSQPFSPHVHCVSCFN